MSRSHLRHFTSLPAADLDRTLECVPSALWEQLRDARVFVTGGTGIFGGWMTRSFLHANEQFGLQAHMTLLVRDAERARAANPDLAGHSAFDFHAGEIADFTFPGGAFTHCLHMATQSFEPRTPENALRKIGTNVQGTLRVLEFAARSGVRHLLYTSSGAVYGPQPPNVLKLPETQPFICDPGNPHEAYAVEKQACEFLCTQAGSASGYTASIARCFAFTGPGLPLDANYAVGNFIGDILANRPITLQGDGRALRSYLHFADMSAWLWTLLLCGEHGQPVNVGAAEPINILNLAQTLRAMAGSGVEIRVLGQADGRPPQRYVPSIRRAQENYGLTVSLPLEQALERTVGFYLENKSH